MRTRFPFCSRYTLKPRLCASPPVFHVSTTRLAAVLIGAEVRRERLQRDPGRRRNRLGLCRRIVRLVRVRLVRRDGRGIRDHARRWPGIVRIEIVAVVEFAIVPSRHVTVPPASEHEPCVVFVERYVTTDGRVSVTVTLVADVVVTVIGDGQRVGKRSSFGHRIRRAGFHDRHIRAIGIAHHHGRAGAYCS